ncbi:MAG: alpha-galactosidase, partial [Victivallaceae bacterium]|nr:alpha-galactosidase [Victivallaceae bacterium]
MSAKQTQTPHPKTENTHRKIKIFNGNVEKPEMNYVSGLTVYREEFSNSKLIGKYWSANGLIEHDKTLSNFGVDMPCQAFSLNLDGQSLEWGWEFISANECEKNGTRLAVIELRHTVRPVAVKVHTEMDGTAFFSRWLEITNTGGSPAALSSLDVFSGILAGGTEISRYADFQKTPYRLGRFTGNNWAQEGRFVWEPLTNGVVSGLQFIGPYGTCGYQCPYFLLSNRYNSSFFVFYLGWSGHWKAEILCDTTRQQMLHVGIGPTASAPMRILQSGETITTPKVHIGYLASDFDGCIQAAHKHIRASVFRRSPKMPKPLLTFNSFWAMGLDELNENAMLSDIDSASESGAEVYMIDAGWYGKASDECRKAGPYPRLMGDWVPGEWFPRGFKPIVDAVHKKGMLFGLWIDIEKIGLQSEIYKEHLDWIVKREGKLFPPLPSECSGLDYTLPEVSKWIEAELSRVVRDYQVDVIRFDGGPLIGERLESGYIENTLWRHYEFHYGMKERLAERFPGLLIENCCGGGGRLDLGILSRSHRTQITDETEIPRIVQILNGISMMLPPEFCVMYTLDRRRKFGSYDLDFLFRVIMFTGAYLGGIPARSPGFQSKLKQYITLYKNFMAPLLSDCRVYHHTPVVRLEGEKG